MCDTWPHQLCVQAPLFLMSMPTSKSQDFDIYSILKNKAVACFPHQDIKMRA